ncbi:glycosyltransferase [Chitinimonas sp. JJ19]|uniref:glycosyltransferase n=1 Tax=Chitinimonas sp. JJ19 TaxID=3109352 RepID=UPI003001192E
MTGRSADASTMRLGLLVPTLNAGPRWVEWLAALASQTRQPDRTLIIDSSSNDQTAELARDAGLEVCSIARTDFDHGGTRLWGLQRLNDCDVVVCMTQDALLSSPEALARLLVAFEQTDVAAAYGRQLPHHDATPLATHARQFNYPARSHVVSYADRQQLGIKTAFCSNSFSAWRRRDLMALGGFPQRTLLAEDMLACARLLQAGFRVAYVADACVAHSHNYPATAEFRRYFDTGALHAGEPWLLHSFGQVAGEGLRYVRSEWRSMRMHGRIWQWRSLKASGMKWLGYQLGKRSRRLPRWLCQRLSMHPRWWQPPGRP